MTIKYEAMDKALNDAAIAVAGTLALPYQVENRKIDPPADHWYLRFTNFRNTTISPNWGEEGAYFVGIFQIDILFPPDIGSGKALEVADTIVDAFPQGASFVTTGARVSVSAKPSVLSTVTNGHETFIPVSIPYRCFET